MRTPSIEGFRSTELGELSCPTCGKPANTATEIRKEGARPSAGDPCICFYCGALCVFVDSPATVAGLRLEASKLDDFSPRNRAKLEVALRAWKAIQPS